MDLKILLCFGTRPEAIKMIPVIMELRRQNIFHKICVTAQHREMLDQVLDFFEIKPDYDFNLMKENQSLNILGSKILAGAEEVFIKESPDVILVQGDTTTALMMAMAAFNLNIRIGHIEAGLRTYDLTSPFPEEANRQLISRISSYHFVPTFTAKQNLIREGISQELIYTTGNTIVDVLITGRKKLCKGFLNETIQRLQDWILEDKKLILVTGHRRENFGKGLEDICDALLEISLRKDVQLIFPVHLNPAVREKVHEKLSGIDNFLLITPVDYPTILWLMEKSDLIISDSGGIQEEAPSFKVPLLVTRETTERQESVTGGFSFLTGTSKEEIGRMAKKLLDNPPQFLGDNPYGDGKAATRIVEVLINHQ